MERDIFSDRRQRERRTTELTEDVLCRRIFGERRQMVRVASDLWWLKVDYLDEDTVQPDKGT